MRNIVTSRKAKRLSVLRRATRRPVEFGAAGALHFVASDTIPVGSQIIVVKRAGWPDPITIPREFFNPATDQLRAYYL